MSLGDRPHVSAELMPPIYYYPGHSLAAPFQEILAGLYLYAQNHSRLILCQSYGYNVRSPASDRANVRRARAGGSYWSFARARRTLPEETQVVRARAVFAIADLRECTIHFRLSVTDGTNTDTQESKFQSEPQYAAGVATLADLTQNQREAAISQYPLTNGLQVYTHDIDVKLADVDATTGAPRVRIHLEAFGVRGFDADSGPDVDIQPLAALAFAEMRY